MDKQGFINYTSSFSPTGSGKAGSYAKAIDILDEIFSNVSIKDYSIQNLYNITNPEVIENIRNYVSIEEKKMRNGEKSIFDYGKTTQTSYPRGGFCSAALRSLKEYAIYEKEITKADSIVLQEQDPKTIGKELLKHFDINKEGIDIETITKQRKGQYYFRRMILSNYNSRCALTGIDIPQLLLASHIIPWSKNKESRLNPSNGICLSALYDKAFDKGLIGFSQDYKVILSPLIIEQEGKDYYNKYFDIINHKSLNMPLRFAPNKKFLEWHMDEVFQK